MKAYSVFCFAMMITVFVSCSNSHEKIRESSRLMPQSLLDSSYHRKNFDSLLADVCKDTSGLDFSEELLQSSSFRLIYEHSDAYIEDAIRVLSKGHFSTMQASVCIFAMQNLSAVDYVNFCQFYLRLYENNKITESMLKQAILPNFLESRIIPENYQDSNVILLLHEVQNNGSISQTFKNEIENVLSGKYLEGVGASQSKKSRV
jgi:hypothetical protein